MSNNSSSSVVWKRTTRQSGAGFSATVRNWRRGCAVISSQPISPGASMRPTFVSRAVGATSTAPSIPPEPRSTSCSPGYAMPLRLNACSARRWRTRRIDSPPRVINTDQAPLYSSAISGVKQEGILRRRCRHRPVQYLNNILEQDHRAIKRRVKAKQGFREFHAAAANDPRIRGHAHDPEGSGAVGERFGCSATDSVHQQALRGGRMRRTLVDPTSRSLAVF